MDCPRAPRSSARHCRIPGVCLSANYANFGVRVFFVISGFLITTLLINEHDRTGSISLKQFYIRRAYRILPAAYFYMLLVIALSWPSISRSDIATALTYTTNFKFAPVRAAPGYRRLCRRGGVLSALRLWSARLVDPGSVAGLAIAAIILAPLLRCTLWAMKRPLGKTDSFFPTVWTPLATECCWLCFSLNSGDIKRCSLAVLSSLSDPDRAVAAYGRL